MKRYLGTIIAVLLVISMVTTTASATTLRLDSSQDEWNTPGLILEPSNSEWSNPTLDLEPSGSQWSRPTLNLEPSTIKWSSSNSSSSSWSRSSEWHSASSWKGESEWTSSSILDDPEFQKLMADLAVRSIVLSDSIKRNSEGKGMWYETSVTEISGQRSSKQTTTTTINGVTNTQSTASESNEHMIINSQTIGNQTTTTVQSPTTNQGTIIVQVPTISETTTTVQVPTISEGTSTVLVPTINDKTTYSAGFNQGVKIYSEYDSELDWMIQQGDANYSKDYQRYIATTKKLLEEVMKNNQLTAKTIRSYNKAVADFPEKTTLQLNVNDASNIQGFQDAITYESYIHAVLEFYYIHDMTSKEYQDSFEGLLLKKDEKATHDSIMKKVESAKKILERYGEDDITVPYFI